MRTAAEVQALVTQWMPLIRRLVRERQRKAHQRFHDGIESDVLYAATIAARNWDPERASFGNFLVRSVAWHFGQVRAKVQRSVRACNVDFDVPEARDVEHDTDVKLDLEHAMRNLRPAEAQLLKARFAEGRLLTELGAELGVTRQRVLQKVKAAIAKIDK